MQKKCSGGINLVIITKIITKIIVPRNCFVIFSARMVPLEAPSKNPLKKHLLVKSFLKTLQRSVLLHEPAGVHPSTVGGPKHMHNAQMVGVQCESFLWQLPANSNPSNRKNAVNRQN